MKSTRLANLCMALGLATFLNFSAQAQVATFNDATNDIAAGISTGGGTLDIVKMEVVDSATDVVFTMTVNGNINSSAGGVDWGNFMIGIANQKSPGTVAANGNGWNRPIKLIAGVTNGVTNGMTHWIGSWVDRGGGNQLWTYGTTNWSQTGTITSFATSPGTRSTITYTVSKASLGVTNGDTIIFDAYSSGGGGGDSAIDALSNPNNSVANWGDSYTSTATNLTRSYTLANTALNTTQNIDFSVDMSAQIAVGTFNPAGGDIVTVDWGSGFTSFLALTDGNSDGVYTGTVSVSAPANTAVPYRFTIEPADLQASLISETVTRSFSMPETATAVSSVYFNNHQAYRDVTFSVNMSVQETLGTFDPASHTVQVRGPFNNWAGTSLTSQGSGIYSATVRVGGTTNAPVDFKFFAGGTGAAGYESLAGNRSFTFEANAGGAPTPALALTTVYFSDLNTAPAFTPVTFAVNMNHQITLGAFNPGTGAVEVRGTLNGWGGTALTDGDGDGIYTRTINVVGAPGSTVEYKFWASAPLDWESVSNRSLILGPTGVTQVMSPIPYFNNNSGQTRDVTFAVDMSLQQAKGLFDPANGVVELRGLGSFNAPDAKTLTRDGSTLVYKGTYPVAGDAGTDFAYKFYSVGLTGTGYEIINPADLYVNRASTLGTSGVAQTLDLAYFSNELFYVTGTPAGFSATQGTASLAQTVSVSGQGLAADIVATAPTGFEVSSDGTTFGATATFVPSAGAVTAASLSVRMTAAGAAGARSGNVALASTGSQSVNVPVSGTVTAVGSTFDGAYQGKGLTDVAPNGLSYLVNYAFGGSDTTTATLPVQDMSDPTKLKLIVVVRTDDNTFTLGGQTSTSLTGGWSSADVTVTDGDNTGLPADRARKVVSVDRGTDPKKFLRVSVTK